MKNSIWDWTLSDFLDRTASSAPTPGGGSVTMVSASLGLGLVIMALEITARKKNPEQDPLVVEDLLAQVRQQLQSLTTYADKDVTAFSGYMSAIALPKQTDAEKRQRKQALEEALLTATTVPLQAARDTLAAIDISMVASRIAHVQVVSDVGAGAAMLGGAMTGVLLNVDINLPRLPDSETKQRFAEEREQLAMLADKKVADILQTVCTRMSGSK